MDFHYVSIKAGADAIVTSIVKVCGRAVDVFGGLSTAAGTQGIVDAAIRNYGRLDVLVNNSAVYESTPIVTMAYRTDSTSPG